jgi:Holliday junction DNA helicase RuvA
MIGKLQGTVDYLGEDHVIIDVGGVGYKVHATSRTLSRLDKQASLALWIETVVREDSITLYGFADRREQEWFLLLTTVQGVGTKVALAILSVLTPEDLLLALAAQDKAAFTRVSGMGPKLTDRLLTELKSKARKLSLAAPGDIDMSLGAPAPASGLLDDTVSALANLGYQRVDALRAASIALKASPAAKLNDLIVLALKELGK